METHTFRQSFVFSIKVKLLQVARLMGDFFRKDLRKFSCSEEGDVDLKMGLVAEHTSMLWADGVTSERELTAGKVQNLRVACSALNGLIIPAGEVFSFWKNVGRATRSKGYVVGRELREGCIIPNVGGGLCQLSNALYDVALKTGLEVLERHAHSKVMIGSLAVVNRDATVFWNYVDLRFRSATAVRLETKLSKDKLIVRLFSEGGEAVEDDGFVDIEREVEDLGNCYSCNIESCFRSQPQASEAKRFGVTAALVDAYTPEFDRYLSDRLGEDDYFMSPIDGGMFRAGSYKWDLTNKKNVVHSTLVAFQRAYKLRKIPKQGRALQGALLRFDRMLAESYAKKLDYSVSHLIVSQNLLPHLWASGCMGGRTFDVLANRLPLSELQSALDVGARVHPESLTLGDFRVDDALLESEREALAHANGVITPHRLVGDLFEGRVECLDWDFPCRTASDERKRDLASGGRLRVFFPASALGRKGVYELVDGLNSLGRPVDLFLLGSANEGDACPLGSLGSLVTWGYGGVDRIVDADVVVLPAYVEHSPRVLLDSIVMGVPVIATKACGLGSMDGVIELEAPGDFGRVFSDFVRSL